MYLDKLSRHRGGLGVSRQTYLDTGEDPPLYLDKLSGHRGGPPLW